MRLPRISLFVTVAVLLTPLFVSCDAGPKPDDSKSSSSLPVRKVLVDKKGRQLDVTILAKSSGYIAVQRISDQSAFSIKIADLNDDTQGFLQSIEESTPEEISAAQQATGAATAGKPIRRARWNRDMSMAVAEANKENLPIYLLFTGSSWCPPCKDLESTILSTPEFQEFANKNLVLMMVDVPRGTGSHTMQKLISKYMVKSYPTLIILDSTEQILFARRGHYPTDVHSYNKNLAEALPR